MPRVFKISGALIVLASIIGFVCHRGPASPEQQNQIEGFLEACPELGPVRTERLSQRGYISVRDAYWRRIIAEELVDLSGNEIRLCRKPIRREELRPDTLRPERVSL